MKLRELIDALLAIELRDDANRQVVLTCPDGCHASSDFKVRPEASGPVVLQPRPNTLQPRVN